MSILIAVTYGWNQLEAMAVVSLSAHSDAQVSAHVDFSGGALSE